MKCKLEEDYCKLVGCAIQVLPTLLKMQHNHFYDELSTEIGIGEDIRESYISALQVSIYSKNRSVASEKIEEICNATYKIIDRYIVDNSATLLPEELHVLENMKSVFSEYKNLNTIFKIAIRSYGDILDTNNLQVREEDRYLSPTFVYRLNKSFKAFCTLDMLDILFLTHLYKKGVNYVKKEIDESLSCHPMTIYSNFLDINKGGLWLKTRKYYTSNAAAKGSKDHTDLIQFYKKLKEYIEHNSSTVSLNLSHEINNYCMSFFLYLIWPKRGQVDSWFDINAIDLLIPFKYCLSLEAKKQITNQLFM